jgi:solute carrier family 25 thiamine pyrophosphate transporter 19
MPPPILQPAQHAASALQNITSNPSAVAFCSGAIAGTAATLATYPFDICRTAFAARGLSTLEPGTIQSFFKQATSTNVINQNPLRNLFAGCGPAVLGIIPYMGLNFALYDYLVRTGKKTKVGDAATAGAIAGKNLFFFVIFVN